MNKKAWLRIVEAFIAVLLVASAILFIAISNRSIDVSDIVYERERSILEIISNNEMYRAEIIGIDLSAVECSSVESSDAYQFINYIKKTLPPSWSFVVNVCKPNKFSNEGVPLDVKNIYISETIIGANPDIYEEELKKVRLLVWIESQ